MERPTGVTILAVLSFLGAGLLLLGACVMFLMGAAGLAGMAGGHGIGGPLAALGAFAGVACLILAVLYVVNGVGLLKLRGWGRLLTIILVGLGVIFGVLGLFRQLVGMHIVLLVWQLIILAIDVWILVYMFKPHVKAAFGQSA
ncbi:MAG TPA: hypothetical protein VKS20_07405 [Candidatus Acidoferrales bacterium]|nr:hypothetical protein [Candidatus Acidoferrales bacterium]